MGCRMVRSPTGGEVVFIPYTAISSQLRDVFDEINKKYSSRRAYELSKVISGSPTKKNKPKPINCPCCGAHWDGKYCEYHMNPKKEKK